MDVSIKEMRKEYISKLYLKKDKDKTKKNPYKEDPLLLVPLDK